MRKICIKCGKYHNSDKLCYTNIIVCDCCNHEQKTKNKDIAKIKCAVCNRLKMRNK